MKALVFLLLTILSLDANRYDEESVNIKNCFIKNMSAANDIIKRGNYKRFTEYESGINKTITHVQNLNLNNKEKLQLKTDLQTYAQIINKIYNKLHTQVPEFHKHYTESINELKRFNKKLYSIGYRPLLNTWYELSKIKAKFIKRPSDELENKFQEKYKLMLIYITELYLDEELEEPLFRYLDNYKKYFQAVSIAYKSAEYKNIKKLKPLCYKIKAKLEFLDAI